MTKLQADTSPKVHVIKDVYKRQILDKTIEYLPAGIVVKDIKNNFKYLYRNRESYNRDIIVWKTRQTPYLHII